MKKDKDRRKSAMQRNQDDLTMKKGSSKDEQTTMRS